MPHFSAMRSAPSNCEVSSYWAKYVLGSGRPGPALVADPRGMRLIDSTPHVSTTSAAPDATSPAPRLVACCEDPHWLSTVVAATVIGRPAASQAVRAMLKDCSPDIVTHPPTTWSTSAGSMPARSTHAFWTAPNRS